LGLIVIPLFAIFGGLGAQEILILAFLVVLLFGRDMARCLGKLRMGLEGELDSEDQSSVVSGLLLVIVCLLVILLILLVEKVIR
jgi:hypothetical protein